MKSRLFCLSLFSLTLLMGAPFAAAQDTDLDELFQEANADISAQDFAAAAEKLKKYTKEKDDNPQAWFLLGYSLHLGSQADGKSNTDMLEAAIKADLKASEFPEIRSTALFNIGCAYSLLDKSKKSLKYLHMAMDSGFNRFDMFDTDSDLDNVRKADGFAEVLARAENNGKRPKKKSGDKGKHKGFVGSWAVTSGSRGGNDVEAGRLPPEITISKKDVTIPAGEQSFVMSYKVVEVKDGIIALDMKIEAGPAPDDSRAKGILKIDGDKAKLCYDPTGQVRPEEFETTEENGFNMFVMKRNVNKDSHGDHEHGDHEHGDHEHGDHEHGDHEHAPSLVGKWKVLTGMMAGRESEEDNMADVITFGKKEITIPFGDEKFVMSYSVNADASPMEIDMKIESGPAPEGSAAVGILKMNHGKFTLCYNAMGGDRPEKFESTEENGFFLFELKKDD